MIALGNTVRACTTGYVENVKEQLEYIVDFMYDNYDSLNEATTCGLLCDLFSKEGFEIERNLLGLKDSFKASFGNEGPTIAYICEYSSNSTASSKCSHNYTSAMNAGAALGLKRAINEIGGRVIVFGCPQNSKVPMLNNGAFDNIAAVICGHAASKTYESGSSLGYVGIDFTFHSKKILSKIELQSTINPQNPAIFLLNLIEMHKATYPAKSIISGVIENTFTCNSLIPEESLCKLTINAFDEEFVEFTKSKIIEGAKFCGKFYNCNIKFNQSSHNYLPLKTHTELSKIASHNLKECGIINIHGPITLDLGIDLGNISAMVPTINPGIGVCKNETNLTSDEFNKNAKSSYSKENMIKAACALALTGVDVIQKPEVLKMDL